MKNENFTDISSIPFERELIFNFSRSSGPGGQHVNKVSSKAELRFNIPASGLLSEEQKHHLLNKLKNKITIDGYLIIISQESRSQLKNKEKVLEKFYKIIEKAFKPAKKRISTKPTRSSKEKRLEMKRKLADKKDKRKLPEV